MDKEVSTVLEICISLHPMPCSKPTFYLQRGSLAKIFIFIISKKTRQKKKVKNASTERLWLGFKPNRINEPKKKLLAYTWWL